MLTFVLILLALASAFQPNAGRLLAACIFSTLTILYGGISSGLVGSEYYIGAAMTDLVILILISGVYPMPSLVGRLQAVCIASIVLNFLGWSMWFFYLPPLAYDWAFIGLYVYAVYALVKRDHDDVVGRGSVHSWFSRLRIYPRPRNNHTTKNEG